LTIAVNIPQAINNPISMPHLTAAIMGINPVKAANITHGATAITTAITVTTLKGMIKESISPVPIIMRRITFTSFREVFLRSRPRATSAL